MVRKQRRWGSLHFFFSEHGAFKALFEEVLLLQIFSQQNCSAAIDPADEDGEKCNKCNPPVLPFFPPFLSFCSGSKHAIKSAALFSAPRLRQQRVPEQRRGERGGGDIIQKARSERGFFFCFFFFINRSPFSEGGEAGRRGGRT